MKGAELEADEMAAKDLTVRRATLREVEAVILHRLRAAERLGPPGAPGGCALCHDAEARALLAEVRRLLEGAG